MLQEAQQSVTPPTRNRRNEKEAALLHLAKMRAASTAVLAYVGLNLEAKEQTALPRNALAKCHHVALQGAKAIATVLQELQEGGAGTGVVATDACTLEDAWNKVLVPAQDVPDETAATANAATSGTSNSMLASPAKRLRLSTVPRSNIFYKSRVLLTRGRKTPSSLLQELRRKRATLNRGPDGDGTHLILEFGTAFTMTIYMVPLLVTIRAQPRAAMTTTTTTMSTATTTATIANTTQSGTSTSLSSSSPSSFCKRTPIHEGLMTTTLPTATTTATSAISKDRQHMLHVWGVRGAYAQLGHVVEERLRYASAHGTQVLRKCFGRHVRSTALAHFEVELLEATALLEFLHLARTTYMSHWQDDT